MQNVHFTPPELARRLGVNESTIKRWIDRGILASERTAGGHRRVAEAQLRAFIEKNPALTKKSYTLARWREEGPGDPNRYYTLHLEGAHAQAREYLHTRYVVTGSLLSVIEGVVLPTLHAIGAAWIKGDIDIADEHRMSFCIRSDLLALGELVAQRKEGPLLLLACVPQENHELSLVLLAAVARERGWRTNVLGINVPLAQVAGAAEKLKARAIAITKVYQNAGSSPKELIRLAHEHPGVRVFVGGPGWDETDAHALESSRDVSFLPSYRAFADELASLCARHLVRGPARRKRV